VLTAVMPFIGGSEAEARAKRDKHNALARPELGLVTLASQLNVDLSSFPLSATLADIARSPLIHPAAAEKLLMQGPETTLEELGRIFASSVRVPQLVGTGAQIADQLADIFVRGGSDGFVISPAYLPGSFSEFVESVIPHLQRKGLFRTAYEGSTLREHLGLSELP